MLDCRTRSCPCPGNVIMLHLGSAGVIRLCTDATWNLWVVTKKPTLGLVGSMSRYGTALDRGTTSSRHLRLMQYNYHCSCCFLTITTITNPCSLLPRFSEDDIDSQLSFKKPSAPAWRAYAHSGRAYARKEARDTARAWRTAPERDSRASQPRPQFSPGQNRSGGQQGVVTPRRDRGRSGARGAGR